MTNIVFLIITGITHWVDTLRSGLHIFSSAWRRYETCQGLAIDYASRLAMHWKKRTLHCIQLPFSG